MILDDVKKTLIFKDSTDDFNAEYFSIKKNKFLTNIDTFYYSIYLKLDNENLSFFQNMIKYLDNVKENFQFLNNDLKEVKISGNLVYRGKSFGAYSVGFEVDNKFVVFFMRSFIDGVPQAIVQLRSEYLWSNDYKYCIQESMEEIESFISYYSLDVDRVVENRLDFAYHTNYISDMDKFFTSEMLSKNMVSRFRRWSKEGIFDDGDLVCDYISFGRRKSNDVFVRIYNKVQEVISLKHKSFFLKLWLENGLISQYDFWIYERCFIDQSYSRVDFYRLFFYYTFGKDKFFKNQAFQMLSNFDNTDKCKIKSLVNQLTPVPTLIVNFEFQMKRKFTSDLKFSTNTFYHSCLERVFVVIDNISNIHNFITHSVVRFVDCSSTRKKNCKNMYWWDLLRDSVKFTGFKLVREYEVNLEKKVLKNKIVKNIASYSAYSGDLDKTIVEIIENLISEMNENDLDNFEDYRKKRFLQVKDFIRSCEI